ncbi:prolyl oligopeptidase family serine peptidase [Paludibacterium yongneupense]|uniref:prolyl oligopeptidase family serine peptidase n=1 Tax=Paludibacterium yongneupense TaxID=400061 RepID=UPI00048FCF79|nr:prolyl oligopeptidase family serine peptidase [Paludibacterium yongneupense]
MSEILDPYLWLENLDDDDARRWVEGQNALSQARLDGDARFESLSADILATLRDTRQIPFFSEHDGWLYNFHQDAEHPRGIYRRTRLASYRAADAEWEMRLDIDALAASEGQDWYLDGVSHYTLEPWRCLVSLTPGGGDATVAREFDLERGEFVADGFSLPLGKNHFAWRDRDSLFVCPAWEASQLSRAGYPREVWLLQRGQALSDARHLFRAAQAGMMVAAWRFLARDGGVLDMIEASDSFYRKTYYRIDGDGRTSALPLPARCDVEAWLDGDLVVKLAENWRWQQQDYAAGSLLAVAVDPGGALGAAQCLVAPDARLSIETVEASASFILVGLLENVNSRLIGFERRDGCWQRFETAAPRGGVIEWVDQPWASDVLYYSFSDFLTPTGLYRLTLPAGEPECLRSQPASFDAAPFCVEQAEAIAADGTAIPYFLVRRRDAPFDGEQPTLLYGYGGFEVPMLPYYVDNFGPQWLERGGAFVLANIRGGGEFGPAWHQAAQGVRRQVGFDDFICVAEDLIARGVTRPRRLAIEGGSNGGLLVGAAMVQRPELFQAVVCEVPLLDMLGYTRLSAGASWIDEYGDPDDPEQRPHLEAYSPYHRLQPGQRYPKALFTTSGSDDRVHPGHARKMVARLNELGYQALFYESGSGGHGGNAGQEQTAQELARVLVYLYQQLMDD